MKRVLELELIEGENGYLNVSVRATMPLHVAEMILSSALETVRRELLAARIGAPPSPGGIVVARPGSKHPPV